MDNKRADIRRFRGPFWDEAGPMRAEAARRADLFMKIVLQHLETFEYVHSHAGWTSHADAAIGFSSVIAAVDYAVKHHLIRVRVAMKFPDSAHNVEFPPVHAHG